MRILLVSQYFWPESFRINDVAQGLRARGHDVDVITGMPNYPSGRYFPGYGSWGPFEEERGGVAVHRVPIVLRGNGDGWRLLLNYASYAVAASLRVAFSAKKWDVVLAFQLSPLTSVLPALLLRSLKHTPVLAWVQDLWPESISASGMIRSKVVMKPLQGFCSWIYRHCDHVLVQSEAFIPRLKASGIAPDRLSYLPNWAEDLYGAPSGAPTISEAWMGGFPVMFAGNMGRVQSLETILDAAERLRDDTAIRWVFLGEGALRGWLESEVTRRGLTERIYFLGRRPVDEMPSFFACAGALLVTLKGDEIISLTIPSKIQSYLAAGVPILGALDGEGARVINESQAGWAGPADDAVTLAANVKRMASLSQEARAEMGRRGRAYSDAHFGRTMCLDRLEQMLTSFQGKREA